MTTFLIILAVLALIGWAAYTAYQRFHKGSACCGTREEGPKKVSVRDRNPAHYPYTAEARITGMTCENCARRVENALNTQEGIWAAVRIDTHKAVIRCKTEPQEKDIRDLVHGAGYGVADWTVRRR